MKGESLTPSLADMAEAAARRYPGLRSQLPLSELRELQPSRESLRAHLVAAQLEREARERRAALGGLRGERGPLRAALQELAERLGALWPGLRGEQARGEQDRAARR
jgi:hypothetical protein